MENFHIFRIQKITGANGLLIALKHNKREFQKTRVSPSNIDPLKSVLNYSLTQTASADTLDRLVKSKLALAGINKLRKNGVLAVEVLFSLPIAQKNNDTQSYFKDCYEWIKSTFQGELISFDVHLDESAPHAHVLILPLIDGKLQGSNLVGGRGNLFRLHNLFYRDVASHYGFSKQKKSSLSTQARDMLIRKILITLKLDPVIKSDIWPIIRNHIQLEPMLYGNLLGIKPSISGNKKSFVDYKRAKGRGSFIR